MYIYDRSSCYSCLFSDKMRATMNVKSNILIKEYINYFSVVLSPF